MVVARADALHQFTARPFDWGQLKPLHLRVRSLVEGYYSGVHRSPRRGAGVEFGGFREYSMGDDLRWLDRRARLLHDRMIIRQFETETERALFIVIDATRSMLYRGERAHASKFAYAALIAAAVAKIALDANDPASLTIVGGEPPVPVLPLRSGPLQLERTIAALEATIPTLDATRERGALERAFEHVIHRAPRGSIVVACSDVLDVTDELFALLPGIATKGRYLHLLHMVDPDERDLPFAGSSRFVGLEGDVSVETDGDMIRGHYVQTFEEHLSRVRRSVEGKDCTVQLVNTADKPLDVLRALTQSIR